MSKIYHQFPIVMDWTQISTFKGCPVKWFYSHCLHLSEPMSVHLQFGACYAKGLEVTRLAYFQDGIAPDLAVAMGKEAIIASWAKILPSYNEEDRDEGLYTLELVAQYDPFALETKNVKTCVSLYLLLNDEIIPISLPLKA